LFIACAAKRNPSGTSFESRFHGNGKSHTSCDVQELLVYICVKCGLTSVLMEWGLREFFYRDRGTGVSGLTKGLATLPRNRIQEPSVVRDRDGRPPRRTPWQCTEVSLG